MERADNHQHRTESGASYYRIAVKNGAAVVIGWSLFVARCWLCVLEREISLQGLGQLLIVAAGLMTIGGSYRITHYDWEG